MLPHDLLPNSKVYDYFNSWRDNSTFQHMNDAWAKVVRQLESESEKLQPSAASIDSQTAKASERIGSRVYNAANRIKDLIRNIAVDTLDLLSVIVVTVSSVDHAHAARSVMKQLRNTRLLELQSCGLIRDTTITLSRLGCLGRRVSSES